MSAIIEKIDSKYKQYLLSNKDKKSKNLNKLSIITGVTCIGKTTLIQKLGVPFLSSYKTSDGDIKIRGTDKKISPEEFYTKFKNGDFFDVYGIEGRYYGYSLSEYNDAIKDNKEVFIDISIENLIDSHKYSANKVFVLDYSNPTLNKNISKRIMERNYSEKEAVNLKETIKREKIYLNRLKSTNKDNIVFIKNVEDLENYIHSLV